MTTESPDRKDLESKDKDSLVAIAKAMGGSQRLVNKTDLVDIIIELAGGKSSANNQSEDDNSG